MPSYHISNFYKFTPLTQEDLPLHKENLTALGKQHNLRGLILIAPEGINATIAGAKESVSIFEQAVIRIAGPIVPKYSRCAKAPFPRFKIKIKPEIVALKDPAILPKPDAKKLSPQEWQHMMAQKDTVVLDTRNWYETQLGKFEGATDYHLEHFSDLPKTIAQSPLPKNNNILIYCTGGIRCAKAATAMADMGYDNVYQLEGGILKYLEEKPHQKFTGECFVFDHRVAVTQDLSPSSRYSLCPQCGQPGDLPAQCAACQKSIKLCAPCLQNSTQQICSKACGKNAKVQIPNSN